MVSAMDYRYIDWDGLFKDNHPCLFKSTDGHPITFYFAIDNSVVKQKLEQLVLRNGGFTVEKYFEMTPMTALMVDEKSLRNFYNRVSFKTSYILDCISSGYLYDINEYIHSDIPTTRSSNYMDVIFLRKLKFYDEKSCSCCKRNCNVINIVTNELPDKNPQNNVNFRCGSNCKAQTMRSEQCLPLPNHRFEIENARKNVEKCLNPCSHCSLQLGPARPSTSHYCPSNIHSVDKKSNEIRSTRVNDVNLDSRNPHSNIKGRYLREDCTEQLPVSDNERDNLQQSTDSEVEDSASRPPVQSSDNDSDIPTNTRRRKVVISDDGESIVENEDNDKNTYVRVLTEDEDDIGPPAPSQSRLTVPDKHTRKLYSRKEKEAILKYIIKHDAIDYVKGMVVWKKMERSNICPQRTWMSMQNHFKKSLCKELDQFAFLTASQKKALRG